jgi:hypothetical protein
MAHIYFSFDFGTDEGKAQQARHKLEMWKQAFRLDKKMLYKFERETGEEAASDDGTEKGETSEKPTKKSSKGGKSGNSKTHGQKNEDSGDGNDSATGSVRLLLRLAFSGHEKMTEDRLLKKFPAEEPFSEMPAKPVREGEAEFAELESKFESLD